MDEQPTCNICGEYLFESKEIKAAVHFKCDMEKCQSELEDFIEMLDNQQSKN